jgi:hypothetical protein
MAFEDVANRMRARHQPYESADEAPIMVAGSDPISYKLALSAHHDRARRLIITGVIWLGAGIAITAVTQSMAEEAGGGTYVIAYGPMIAGIIYLLKGLLATPPKRP